MRFLHPRTSHSLFVLLFFAALTAALLTTRENPKDSNKNDLKIKRHKIKRFHHRRPAFCSPKRRIHIPKGSVLSLAVQLSRPGIFDIPEFIEDAILIDGVIETPIWFEIDEFVKSIYNSTCDSPSQYDELMNQDDDEIMTNVIREEGRGNKGDAKSVEFENHRCVLFQYIELFTSIIFSLEAETSRACLLRAICEIQAMAAFYPGEISDSLVFEIAYFILSPSQGSGSSCIDEKTRENSYLKAEMIGVQNGHCAQYNYPCPINFSRIFLSNIFPQMLRQLESYNFNII